tara:strand:- start:3505 stop:3927 length:423 start_codon:yes stop_codon:yes gene_type:complete
MDGKELLNIIKKLRIRSKNSKYFNEIYKYNTYNSRYTGIIKDKHYYTELTTFIKACYHDSPKKLSSEDIRKLKPKAEKILDGVMNKLKVKSVNIKGQPNVLISIYLLSNCKKINPKSKEKPLKISKAELELASAVLYGNK